MIFLTGYSVYFILTGNKVPIFNPIILFLEIVFLVINPTLNLIIIESNGNDCCDLSSSFSPDHLLTVYTLIILCVISYFYSKYKKSFSSPILEVLLSTFLLIGIFFNIFYAIHFPMAIPFVLPIIILFIGRLGSNHLNQLNYLPQSDNKILQKFQNILKLDLFTQLPILFALMLPVLTILMLILLLFGQKPDSLILAFTETYFRSFSQMTEQCEHIDCDGHYLCTVAAKGHHHVVKPIRLGKRAGKVIVCNRQLLISNAFEELLADQLPFAHKTLRHNYNKVGKLVHRHYHFFENKWLSDFIYLLMKPLEYFFLLYLYLFDKKPEDRIAVQYLKWSDRRELKNLMSNE